MFTYSFKHASRVLFLLSALFIFNNGPDLHASACCPSISTNIVLNSPNDCCYYLVLDRQDTQGCEITKIRITTISGLTISSAAAFGAGVGISQTSSVAVWDQSPQFPQGQSFFGEICFSSSAMCGTIKLEYFDHISGNWICGQFIDICCPAWQCCPELAPTLVPVNGSNCCFDVYLDRGNTQGCEITHVRVKALTGAGLQSASTNNPNVTATQLTANVAVFEHNSQFSQGLTHVGQVCFDATDLCGTVKIDFRDAVSNSWICNVEAEWCCGTWACCPDLEPMVYPSNQSACCYEIDIQQGVGILCEITKVRATLSGGGMIYAYTNEPAFTATQTGNTVEWAKNSLAFVNGSNIVGTICFDDIPPCATLTLEYFDFGSGTWICQDEIEICCAIGGNLFNPEDARESGADIPVRQDDVQLTTDVEKPAGTDGLSLYVKPNPANAQALIQFNLRETANVNLAIYDMNGTLVSQLINNAARVGENQVELNTQTLSQGQYMVRLSTADGRTLNIPLSVVR